MFETASFHIIKPCNMKCKFCYATFEDINIVKQLSLKDACIIINKLQKSGLQKITFAGGEPLLYKYIKEVIIYAKEIGLTTSIITNGSMLNKDFLKEMQLHLDWIGISIDSINNETNKNIGRTSKTVYNYYELIDLIKKYNYKLKINTVVNRFNENESMQSFIEYANPSRWKIFDTLKVEGQNDIQFEEIKSNNFQNFISNHNHHSMVVENNTDMTGSYLLIDPQGRLFENSKGKHTYSNSIINNDFKECLTQISLNRESFIKRGGIYNW